MSQPGPFGAFPQAEPKPLAPAAAQLQYLRSFQYIFENPTWALNLIWAFLCHLAGQAIPIVPAMVLWGYQFEVIEDLTANGGVRYPDFNINRLGEYLSRGVWPVLVLLLYVFVFAIFGVALFIATFACSGGLADAGGENFGRVGALVGVFVGVVFGGAGVAALSIYSTPMMLRAGLAQDLGAAFDFAWVNSFVSKMWVETVLSSLFLVFGVVLALLVTCFIAGIVLIPMLPFASSHFLYQLYTIYLSRGGTPIPLKPRPMAVSVGAIPQR